MESVEVPTAYGKPNATVVLPPAAGTPDKAMVEVPVHVVVPVDGKSIVPVAESIALMPLTAVELVPTRSKVSPLVPPICTVLEPPLPVAMAMVPVPTVTDFAVGAPPVPMLIAAVPVEPDGIVAAPMLMV